MAGQRWSFTDGWILAAIGVLAVTIAAAVAGVGPRTTRLKAALAAAGDGAAAAPAELTAAARDPVLHGAMRLQLVALVEIVYLMARKPSGVGILVSLLVAAVAVVAVCWPLVGGRQAGMRGRSSQSALPSSAQPSPGLPPPSAACSPSSTARGRSGSRGAAPS